MLDATRSKADLACRLGASHERRGRGGGGGGDNKGHTNEQLEGLEGEEHWVQDQHLAVASRALAADNIHGCIFAKRDAGVHPPPLIPTA